MAKAELNKKTSEFLVTVSAEKATWQAEQEKAFQKLAKNLSIKGFRKGQVPADMARKHVSNADIMTEAIKPLLDILIKEASKEIKDDLMVLDSPTYRVEKISDAELEVTFIYPVYPEIKLPDYKNLNVKYEESKVDSKRIQDEIEKVRDMQAQQNKKDGAIAKGDIANFDFEGFVDGEAFQGGKAEKYDLEIGSGQFIPGFEDQMIGLKVGDEKDVKVTFPESYHAENLKGKEAVFKIKIHEIKSKSKPEVDEKFVKSLGIKDVSTKEQLEKYLENLFKDQAKMEARGKFQKEAFAKIKEQVEINIPTSLVAKEMKNQEAQFAQQMKQQGLTIEQYIKMTGIKPETLMSQYKAQAIERLKDSLIFAEIAKLEKIEITDAEYEAEYVKLAKVYGQDEKSIRNVITKAQMQIPMTNDKVIDILIKGNK